ncbi:MAG: pentapeptide repeat-containing protein [Defluviicoccus sp.]|nr:MAG: pentapeptide repeat-containing protein [Defluviicoccus sp.]
MSELPLLVDGHAQIAAAAVAKALTDGETIPYRLEDCVIEGDLDLRFARIGRCVDFSGCRFTGSIDLRNATFEATAQLQACEFDGEVNAGDQELAHTIFKSDLNFDGSTFNGFVSFIGFHCAASVSLRHCRFNATASRPGEFGPRRSVEFIGGKVFKAFSVNASVFAGSASFNGLACEFAGFFHDTQFHDQGNLPVDFVASSFRIGCDLSRARFAAVRTSRRSTAARTCGLGLARIVSPAHDIRFDFATTRWLQGNGVMFCGPVSFSGLQCSGDAFFSPFSSMLDVHESALASAGPISPALRSALETARFPVPENARLARFGETCEVVATSSDGDQHWRCLLGRLDNGIAAWLTTQFRGSETTFSNAEFKRNLDMSYATFVGSARFESLACTSNANFQRARFDSWADFSNSRVGLELQLRKATFRSSLQLDGCRAQGVLAEGITVLGWLSARHMVVARNIDFGPFSEPLQIEPADVLRSPLASPQLRSELAGLKLRLPSQSKLIPDKRTPQHLHFVCNRTYSRSYLLVRSHTIRLQQPSVLGDTVNFGHADARSLILSDALIVGRIEINGSSLRGGGFFRRTIFRGTMDSRFTSYGVNLQAGGAEFRHDALFRSCKIGSSVVLSDARFLREANFSLCRMNELGMGYGSPFVSRRAVFRGCTFDRFDTLDTTTQDRRQAAWQRLIDSQDSRRFSLDPYLALEKCYRTEGRHQEADAIYFEGRAAQRRERGNPRIPPLRWVMDTFSQVLTGYGVRQTRLWLWIGGVLLLSTLIYWPDRALVPKSPLRRHRPPPPRPKPSWPGLTIPFPPMA